MPLLELKGAGFAYTGQPPVFSDVQLSLQPGEKLALTGQNGAGKSTLLRCLTGLEKLSTGTVTAFGEERHSEAEFQAIRGRIGMLFQDADDQLFAPTVLQDVAFGPLNQGLSRDEAKTKALSTLGQLGIAHLADRICRQLSGGQKRLVSLAGVLAMGPEILLLDEPTNDLDDDNRAHLLTILQGLDQAMILVSHDRAFRTALCTRETRLENGRISDAGGSV